jgi:[ribosomal protein S18]-alanine N-acetyltransferase
MIRDFDPADVEGVCKLLAGIPEAAQWPAHDLLLGSQKNFLLRVAEEEGILFGLIAFRITADEAEILDLAVDSGRRRQGMASRLIEDVIAACKAAGVGRIFLEVRNSNRPARNLYTRMGFTEVGRRREYYRQPAEDALVLARRLTED